VRRRVRHHVNPFHAGYLARAGAVAPVPLDGWVGVEVELGCADARFLFERAPRHPDTLFVGLEIRRPLVDEVNREAERRGLANLKAVFAHINVELEGLFPDGAILRAFINFPDPWFKERQKKRRLVTAELVALLHRKLVPGGELFFQSDVWDLALDALAEIELRDDLFENLSGAWSFCRENPYGARSLREVRCEEAGAAIWRMRYRAR
jgi:tRNA (guanine-N7-)-methyltransferase